MFLQERQRCEEKQALFYLYHSAAFKDSLQQQFNINGNIFETNCYRWNEGSLYCFGHVFAISSRKHAYIILNPLNPTLNPLNPTFIQ